MDQEAKSVTWSSGDTFPEARDRQLNGDRVPSEVALLPPYSLLLPLPLGLVCAVSGNCATCRCWKIKSENGVATTAVMIRKLTADWGTGGIYTPREARERDLHMTWVRHGWGHGLS